MKPLFNHHIDPRFLFTPFTKVCWNIELRDIDMYYIFGIRIARIHKR